MDELFLLIGRKFRKYGLHLLKMLMPMLIGMQMQE